MASNRVIGCRGSVSCATLWLIIAVASTLEVYDEVPLVDSDGNNVYQDNTYRDTGPEFRKPMTQFRPPVEGQLLNEILKAWQQKMDYRQTWNSVYVKPKVAKEYRNPGLENIGIMKRFVDVLSGSRMQYSPLQSLRPQQKWKIKKGRVIGSQIVCYFKLCAFRTPT